MCLGLKMSEIGGIEVGRFYDPDFDCWFVTYKFSSKAFDRYQKEEMELEEQSDR